MNPIDITAQIVYILEHLADKNPKALFESQAGISLSNSGIVSYHKISPPVQQFVATVRLSIHSTALKHWLMGIMDAKPEQQLLLRAEVEQIAAAITRQLLATAPAGSLNNVATLKKPPRPMPSLKKFMWAILIGLTALWAFNRILSPWYQASKSYAQHPNEQNASASAEYDAATEAAQAATEAADAAAAAAAGSSVGPSVPFNTLQTLNSAPLKADACAAPNGRSWPSQSAYLKKMPVRDALGLSLLTIDNSQVDEDVYVKVVNLDSGRTARNVMIKAHDRYTLVDFSPGNYQVFAKFLNFPCTNITKTEAFSLQQYDTLEGTQYSSITLTLYKVANGNMHTTQIDESEFNAAL